VSALEGVEEYAAQSEGVCQFQDENRISENNMKRVIFMSLLMLVGIALTGCSSCHSDKAKQETKDVVYHDYDGVVQDFTAGVAHIQSLHRQTAYSVIHDKTDRYQWRNSRVIFSDTLTLENIDDLHVTDINDVFYYWDNEKGPQVQYVNVNVKRGTQVPYPINDIWIEDDDLSDAPIVLTCEDALQRLKEWNGILPKARYITLRVPVGSLKCNPQWTLGDTHNVLFIDAVTGEVSDWCPAFTKEE